jgi:hypothetical protein
MSGFFQFWMERLPFRRWAMVAGFVALALFVSGGRSWAQQDEPDEGGMSESSLQKKKPGEKKAPGEVLPPPRGMMFTTGLDRTALWVGDQFHYYVTVEYTPEYEFVLDNLTKETVNMEPLQVMGVEKTTTDLKNKGKRLVVDMTLATFATGQTSMQLPQFTLYYFRKDKQTTGLEQAAAESLTIPGPVVGLRSTLPPQPSDIRDGVNVDNWQRSRWILPIAAWASTVILVIGVGWEVVLFAKKQKARRGPDPRKAMEAVRARWASHVPPDFADPQVAMKFYSNSYQDVKEYVGYFLDTPTLGLTAEELQEEMQRLGSSPEFTRRVVKVLDACEALLYAPDGTTSNSEAARGVAQDVREVLNSKA